MSDTFFTLDEQADGVTLLQLCRPERMNTMTPAFFPALRDAVNRLNAEGRTRVLVIGSSGKHFSAGMALDVFGGGESILNTRDARHRLAFQDGLRQLM
ncbi:MAG: enoyl-CoA hydratase, partial [Burkholderiaceae bacterium]|nr:enoyl-CoA hydratase [Burkholderiaceae bacterium]